MIVFWFVVDRFTVGLLPDPLRPFMRWRRRVKLEQVLAHNPHDGRARLELAQLYVERGNGKRAVEVLRPTFDNGADDIQSVFTMGEACLQAGYADQGEKLLAHAEDLDADFRVGELFLVRGKHRLARGDFEGARKSLQHFVGLRTGTVEGRVLLSRAHLGLGDDATAAMLRDAAWHEYEGAPRFRRRQERFWAWRAKPSRPALYGVLVLLLLVFLWSVVVPQLNAWAAHHRAGDVYSDPGLDDPDE